MTLEIGSPEFLRRVVDLRMRWDKIHGQKEVGKIQITPENGRLKVQPKVQTDLTYEWITTRFGYLKLDKQDKVREIFVKATTLWDGERPAGVPTMDDLVIRLGGIDFTLASLVKTFLAEGGNPMFLHLLGTFQRPDCC